MVFRRQSASTNERTLVSTIIPPSFHADNLAGINVCRATSEDSVTHEQQLLLTAIFNSFVSDWLVRQKVTTNLNIFYLYQLPVPRLTAGDAGFAGIVERAGRLICTTPEFDDLAREVGLEPGKAKAEDRADTARLAYGVTDPAERAGLRAELDGMVAHLYGLSEAEFEHVLATFPLVEQGVRDAALRSYRDLVVSGEAGVLNREAADVNPSAPAVDGGGHREAASG